MEHDCSRFHALFLHSVSLQNYKKKNVLSLILLEIQQNRNVRVWKAFLKFCISKNIKDIKKIFLQLIDHIPMINFQKTIIS